MGSKGLPFAPLLVAQEAGAAASRLIHELRSAQKSPLGDVDPSQGGPNHLLWRMVADGVPEAAGWQGEARNEDLCERALRLRGGMEGGPHRLVMRERARVLAHLCAIADEPPRIPSDLLSLWDEATRLEPVVRLRIPEARWRTADDAIPFTTTLRSRMLGEGPRPLPPGKQTADPAEIPALVDRFLAFLARDDLDPVLKAVHVPHLMGRIHPFVDGNGHTGRMLMCDLLSRAGFGAPTLVAYISAHHGRAAQWGALMDAACLGQAGVDELVTYQLRLLKEAQADVG